MKHFINILLILILTFFAVGIAYLQSVVQPDGPWFFAYGPWMGLVILLSIKLRDDYK